MMNLVIKFPQRGYANILTLKSIGARQKPTAKQLFFLHVFALLIQITFSPSLSVLLTAPSPSTHPVFPPFHSVAEAIHTKSTTATDKERLKLMKYCDL